MPDPELLDPKNLAKLSSLQLRLQSVVEGTLSGLHSSPHHGSSIEFAEHKEYSHGDDIRHLDWKALAKFDRHYIKRFDDETDLKAYFLMDCSGSMEYGQPLTKLEYGSILVASLAYLLIRQGDHPGLLTFGDEVRSYLPPRARSSYLSEVVGTLERVTAEGGTNIARAIQHLTEVIAGRSLVVLVSDLFDTGEDALRLLRHLRARRHHVVLLHLLHAEEIQLPFSEVTLFSSMEDEREILVDPDGIRKAYLAEMGAFLRRTRESCLAGEVEYHQVTTSETLDSVLVRFLAAPGRGRNR